MSSALAKPRLPPWASLAAAMVAAAGTAAWVHHQARRAEQRHPAPGRFIHIDGVRLHYRIAGEGPAVLLVHGSTVHGSDFEASGLLQRLAHGHRVLVIDRPGFGWSDRTRDTAWTPAEQARLLCRAAVALGFERFAVVGHSLGTQVALAMALGDPAHVDRLVLVGGYYFPSLRLDVVPARLGAIPWFGDAMRYTVASLASRLLFGPAVRALFAPQPVPAAFDEQLPRELLLRPLQQRATCEDAAHMVQQARVLRAHYGELKVPVTLVAGARDQVVDSHRQSGRLHRALPHSRLHILDGVGHMAHYHAQSLIAGALATPARA